MLSLFTRIIPVLYNFSNLRYSISYLKAIRLFSLVCELGFLAGFVVSFVLHFYAMLLSYGRWTLIIAFIPYLLFGVIASLFLLIQGKKSGSKIALLIAFIPSTFLTEYGISADLFLIVGAIIAELEKSQRRYVTQVVALFSKEYSPLYDKRLANKNKYKLYARAYHVLGCLDINDFELIKEEHIKTIDHKTGLTEASILRTFKIKGMFSKITVRDDLYIAPQKSKFLPFRRRL